MKNTNSTSILIECTNLQKSFPLQGKQQLDVLKGINLTLQKGEFKALMGPSGSGKSTLLNILGGLIPHTAGEVVINGKELSKMSNNERTLVRRQDIGWIFQDFNLVDNLTALENVMVPLNFAGKTDNEAKDRAISLLKQLGIGDRIHHFPDTLSGGQQQRVAIARALANDPGIILADEPTGNLDSQTGLGIIRLFKDLAEKLNKGILMVTHDVDLAQASQKVYVLRNGKLEEQIAMEVM